MPLRNHKGKSPDSGFQAETPRFDSTSIAGAMPGNAKGTVEYVTDHAEQAAGALSAGMEAVSKAIRDHEPQEGMLHNAGEAIAEKLECGGKYLEERGLQGVGEDVTNLIRRNPVPAVIIGVGLGVLLARLMMRR